jgi:hypothetical protein
MALALPSRAAAVLESLIERLADSMPLGETLWYDSRAALREDEIEWIDFMERAAA